MTCEKLDLDTKIRDSLVRHILDALNKALPESEVELRGSIAEGCADLYSDIDILWEVPDNRFDQAVSCLATVLSNVGCIDSLRSDPTLQNSCKHRLFFVLFKGVSLFWRVDIEVFAQSTHRNPDYDLHNDSARGNGWSLSYSALMNAVAAVKAFLRGKESLSQELLLRAFDRIGVRFPNEALGKQILNLIQCAREKDPGIKPLAEEVVELCDMFLGSDER